MLLVLVQLTHNYHTNPHTARDAYLEFFSWKSGKISVSNFANDYIKFTKTVSKNAMSNVSQCDILSCYRGSRRRLHTKQNHAVRVCNIYSPTQTVSPCEESFSELVTESLSTRVDEKQMMSTPDKWHNSTIQYMTPVNCQQSTIQYMTTVNCHMTPVNCQQSTIQYMTTVICHMTPVNCQQSTIQYMTTVNNSVSGTYSKINQSMHHLCNLLYVTLSQTDLIHFSYNFTIARISNPIIGNYSIIGTFWHLLPLHNKQILRKLICSTCICGCLWQADSSNRPGDLNL